MIFEFNYHTYIALLGRLDDLVNDIKSVAQSYYYRSAHTSNFEVYKKVVDELRTMYDCFDSDIIKELEVLNSLNFWMVDDCNRSEFIVPNKIHINEKSYHYLTLLNACKKIKK